MLVCPLVWSRRNIFEQFYCVAAPGITGKWSLLVYALGQALVDTYSLAKMQKMCQTIRGPRAVACKQNTYLYHSALQ